MQIKSYIQYLAAALPLLSSVAAQQAGTITAENHPRMTWKRCSGPGNCQTVQGEVVIDANWRWLHNNGQNCYEGNKWTSQCSSATDCAQRCALDGANYQSTYGASTSGDSLTLKFVTKHEYGTNIGSRFYLMANQNKYQMFTLMNNEFAFDVDLSKVECGINSALYFVAMEEDGGMASYPSNRAGAKYGTGYCDAQCARDLKFIGGKANIEGWRPSTNDPNAGVGPMGACCAEIDVWESNAYAYAFTPHACGSKNRYHICETNNCGGTYSDDRFAGYCDANGCDYNPYRMGNKDFYGKGKTVDTNRKFTVVSRFERNRLSQFFVQDGRKIEVPPPTWPGLPNSADITPELCDAQFRVFDDRNRFAETGGFDALNEALTIPMVLVMSIWDDHHSNMLWLDSSYPPEKAGLPGGDRGPCPTTSGVPAEVEAQYPNAQVVWSNIRFGPIGSTVNV
uniref:Glucanase n=2 Tax=Chaetomiaceae TaxID=35718 RepID=O94093_9PEZI